MERIRNWAGQHAFGIRMFGGAEDGQPLDNSELNTSADGARESDAYVPAAGRAAQAANQSGGHTYTELMGGSVPCPSCRGSGRIPTDEEHVLEQEAQLVALIPVTDKRLQPRRTWLWVLLGMLIVAMIFGFTMFFVVPRSVSVTANRATIHEIEILEYKPQSVLIFSFLDELYVLNNNFYGVQATNVTSWIVSLFHPFSTERIGRGFNHSEVTIDSKAQKDIIWVNNTVTIKDTTLKYCEDWGKYWPAWLVMEFDITVTLSILGHEEQDTVTVQKQVCCKVNGNCTDSNDQPWINEPYTIR